MEAAGTADAACLSRQLLVMAFALFVGIPVLLVPPLLPAEFRGGNSGGVTAWASSNDPTTQLAAGMPTTPDQTARSKPSRTVTVPLFSMDVPYAKAATAGRLSLHMFEPRYRELVRRALKPGMTVHRGYFGYVDRPPIGAAGGTAQLIEITEHQWLPDGRVNIECIGRGEATVKHAWVELDSGGLWIGELNIK
eukprot:SAG31_NODE_15_length_37942_cov_32.078297_15_plen_193_part_00